MGVSENSGTPQITHFNKGFPWFSPSILGFPPYFWISTHIWSEKGTSPSWRPHFLMPKIPYFKAQVYCAHLSHTGICSAWMKKPAKSSWGTKTSVVLGLWKKLAQKKRWHFKKKLQDVDSKKSTQLVVSFTPVLSKLARWLPVLPAAQLLHWLQCNQPTKRWMLQQCQWARKSGTYLQGCRRLQIRASNPDEKPRRWGWGMVSPFLVYCASGKFVVKPLEIHGTFAKVAMARSPSMPSLKIFQVAPQRGPKPTTHESINSEGEVIH